MRQTRRRTLCIWLPQWPIQRRGVARQANAEVRATADVQKTAGSLELTAQGSQRRTRNRAALPPRTALVIYEQYRQGSFRVVACSAEASQCGVVPGMPLAEATSLAPAKLDEDNPQADLAALQSLAEWCESFSPVVGLENAPRPESLLLDIEGLAPLFAGEERLIEQIARSFAKRGLIVRLAAADTVGAAWAAAHYAESDSEQSEERVVVQSGQEEAALAPLPVEALRLSSPTVQMLARLGIRQVGQLLALPKASLAARFEPELIERLNQAFGMAPEPILAHRPPPEIFAERCLEYPLNERKAVEMILAQLIEQVAAALAVRCQGAIRLQCEFDCQTSESLRFLIGLFEASAAAGHLLGLAQMQLEQIRLPGPVVAIRVLVLLAAALPVRQQELFVDERQDRRQLGLLADRLSSRLQREAVSRAVLVPDAQPEYAYRYEPLTGNGSKRSKSARKHPTLSGPRPLWLQHAATPLEVLSVVPPGQLMQFCYQGRQHRVLHRWGPERIQTGWWRGRQIKRDYYRIETESGNRFCIFRRLHDGQWFLHGIFD
jgi:protein ImuB